MKSGSAVNDPCGDDLPEIVKTVELLLGARKKTLSLSPLVAESDRASLRSLDASSVDLAASDARTDLVRQGGGNLGEVLSIVRARRVRVTAAMPFVSVLHLDELGAVRWHEAETNLPTTPGKLAKPGDVILSLLNPAKFRATVIPDRYPQVQVSAEFGVFTSKINPYAALALLQHPLVRAQLAPMGRGTSSSRRRVDAEEILEITCPPYNSKWERATGRSVQEMLNMLDTASRALFETFNQRLEILS
jgi:hypothetical protein